MAVLKNSKGFSLIQVMIAAGLAGGLALFIAKLTKDQVKSVKTVEMRFEYQSAVNDIRNILTNRASCAQTFANNTLANFQQEGALTVIKHVSPSTTNDRYPVGLIPSGGGVSLASYRLVRNDPDGSIGFSPADSLTGSVYLIVKFDLGQGKAYSARFVERKIRLNVLLNLPANNSAARITECTAQGSQDDYVKVVGDMMTGDLQMQSGSNIILHGTSELYLESDKRLKYDVKDMPLVLEKISKVRPVTFRWKESGKQVPGVIAQELRKVFPELVKGNEKDEYLAVDYLQIIPYMIQGMKELKKENDELKDDINVLKKSLCQKYKEESFCKEVR